MNEQSGAAQRRDEGAENTQPTGENRSETKRGGRNRHRRQHRSSQPEASLNMVELREIAELINHHGFTDFEFENENIRVRLRKELQPQIIQAQNFSPQAAPISGAPVTSSTGQSSSSSLASSASIVPTTTAASIDEDANVQKITSPIVGTFYRAPSPGAESFVGVGSQVAPETIVCIVEAMKLMNEIPAEVSGEIVKIYVENGQPVEYGQPLFAVR